MTEWIISSTVLMLVVMGLRACLKGRIGLKLQYALWLLVLVRLLVPVNLTESALSVTGAAERAMETPAMQTVTEMAEIHPEIYDYAEARTRVAAEYEAKGTPLTSLSKQEWREFEREVQARRAADYTLGDAAVQILKTVWIIGMAVTALCLLAANRRFGQKLLHSRREIPVPGSPLPVYVTGAVETPCLFGLPKPAIYLPADTPWDEAAMEHILTHEGTHYRHGDHIWAVLRCGCLVLHWYNPLVWICAELSRRDGELACDEASIRALGEDRRADYGRTLIDMTCQNPRGMVGLTATTMNYSTKSLKERIVLLARHPKTAACTLALVAAIAALAVGCTFTGTPEEPTEPVPPQAVDEPSYYQGIIQTYSGYYYYRALEREFSAPEEMDFYHFFSFGLGDPEPWNSLTPQERQFLTEQGFQVGQAVPKMTPDQIDAQLQLYFGLTLEEMRDSLGLVYYGQTDCYYSVFQPTPSDWFIAVIDCEVLDDHMVRVYYLPQEVVSAGLYEQDPETGKYYYEGVMALTLRETNEIPQIVANERIPATQVQLDEPLPTQPQEEPSTEPSTQPAEERLAEYQNLFHSGGDWLYNMAAGIVFTRPQDVDLSFLFYNGVGYEGSWGSVSQADRDLMVSRGFWQECDVQIMPAALLEEKLQRRFGVGLADVRIPGEWVYSAESDTYYSNHNDAFGSGVTVNGFADNDDGTVTLLLTVDAVYSPAIDSYLWDQPMCMTLRETEAGWQMVSNVIDGQGNPALIDYYQNLLGWSGGMDYFRALGTIFNTAEDMDPYYFFYGGVDYPARWDELDSAERDYLLEKGLWEEFDLQKMPAYILEERLQRYFGIGLDDVQIPDRWVYYPALDCYYTNHSDAWLPVVTVTDVEEFSDGTARVYLTVDMVIDHAGEFVSNAKTVLTLRRSEDGSWQMVTHAFAQDVV